MMLEKIPLLWSDQLPRITCRSVTMLGYIIGAQVYRFFVALYNAYLLLPALLILSLDYYMRIPLYAHLILYAVIIYLMRPTVGRKNWPYIKDFFVVESVVPLSFFILFFIIVDHVTNSWLTSLFVPLMLIGYQFLYDDASAIPARCMKTVVRTFCAFIYYAPSVLFLTVLFLLTHLAMLFLPFRPLVIALCYPALAALATLLYLTMIHNHYELYYAE